MGFGHLQKMRKATWMMTERLIGIKVGLAISRDWKMGSGDFEIWRWSQSEVIVGVDFVERFTGEERNKKREGIHPISKITFFKNVISF